MNTAHVKSFIRQPYAWPGGYPLFAVAADGGCLCKSCVKDNAKLVIQNTRQETQKDWAVVAVDVKWEDESLVCDHCGKQIESAYGEPNA
jgi:hypothetical protein